MPCRAVGSFLSLDGHQDTGTLELCVCVGGGRAAPISILDGRRETLFAAWGVLGAGSPGIFLRWLRVRNASWQGRCQ